MGLPGVCGDKILLELNNGEVYSGSVEYKSKDVIELYDVLSHNENLEFEENLTFHSWEIQDIKILERSGNEVVENGTSRETNHNSGDSIRMDIDEFKRLREMSYNFTFIDRINENYWKAIEIFNNRESVAIAGLSKTYKRGTRLGLLVMTDFEQVFIFDLLCLQKLGDLQDILESYYIVKVVHDGAILSDCLFHKYGVQLNNVFDTQVTDTVLSKKLYNTDVHRDISQCLEHYFNFPKSLLSAALEDVSDTTWMERPLLQTDKIKAAQLGTYLLSLRDRLMEEILKDYTSALQIKYNHVRKLSDIQITNLKSKV